MDFKTNFLLLFFLIFVLSACKEPKPDSSNSPALDSTGAGPHNLHMNEIGSHPLTGEAAWDSVNHIVHSVRHTSREDIRLNYKTFGWHPYFNGTSYQSYNFRLLWGIAYASYDLNPATGGYSSIHEWRSTSMIDSAQKYGTEVFLAVNNFGPSQNQQFLANKNAWRVLGDSLIVLLDEQKANGVNLDFEQVPEGHQALFTEFVTELSMQLKKHNPAWKVSLALYTVDWNKVFNIPALNKVVDFYTLMGYDYYYAGSPKAGPVSPLKTNVGFAPYNLEKSVDFYLAEGLPKEKFILGLPYYGREWKIDFGNLPNSTLGYVNSPAIADILKTYPTEKADFDMVMSAKYYEFTENNVLHQIWFSDTAALGPKFEFIKKKGLSGVAIWALGMDHGTTQFWDLIERKFAE